VREFLQRLLGDLRFWWRTRKSVDAFTPGRSKLERMRALDRELTWVEDNSEAELMVRVRVER
jgi:hypothetical protein